MIQYSKKINQTTTSKINKKKVEEEEKKRFNADRKSGNDNGN